jgi:hypothetical protein
MVRVPDAEFPDPGPRGFCRGRDYGASGMLRSASGVTFSGARMT